MSAIGVALAVGTMCVGEICACVVFYSTAQHSDAQSMTHAHSVTTAHEL